MAVSNGQKAEATVFNDAFVSKTTDSTTTGVLELANTANVDSGATIENLQRAVNEIFDAVGMTGEADTNRNQYTSNNYVLDGDDRKEAIQRLDAALKNVEDQVTEAFAGLEFAITDGQSATDLTDFTIDSAEYLSKRYDVTVIRGTTVFSQTSVSFNYRDSTWRIVWGGEEYDDSAVTHGITLTFSGTTVAQIRAAASTGEGDGAIYFTLRSQVNA